MASIEISPENNMPTIVGLAGGSLEMGDYRYEDGSLYVQDVTQEALDAALVTYNSDLETHLLQPLRAVVIEGISQAAANFISETYPSFRRELFIALAEEARNSGLTNRVAYINQMFTWVKTIVAAVMAAEDMIDAVMTIEEINSINLNTEVFASTDPEITVRGAMAIED